MKYRSNAEPRWRAGVLGVTAGLLGIIAWTAPRQNSSGKSDREPNGTFGITQGDPGAQQGRQGERNAGRAGGRNGRRGGPQETAETMLTAVPPHAGDILLCRPTDTSIAMTVMLSAAEKVRVEYGPAGKPQSERSETLDVKPGEPLLLTLSHLTPDTPYVYRLVDADTGRPTLPETGLNAFRTQRRRGAEFTFDIQADSHLDSNSSAAVYRSALANESADSPDFLIDLGDTFMTGKHPTRESAARQYLAQRYYLGMVGRSAPVFFTIGNHDGEELKRPEAAAADGLAVWSCLQRKRYFPNPEADRFYTGNTSARPYAGALQDYYAWTWGDALFVVLDPYWTSGNTRRGEDPWAMTLGSEQYHWLARTLRGSKAGYKFVFIHQLVGGTADGGRGGSEVAGLFEWGGKEYDGRDTFARNRPGWEKPIHDLLLETGVTIVFHGHDHFYAHQEKDGLTYQLVPQPSAANSRNDHAEEYGYLKGEFLPSSGHLRVHVSAESVKVQYIRASADDARGPQEKNASVAATYVCAARTPLKPSSRSTAASGKP